ncbi:hypothetical protein PVNG_05792 [Plasmodium vivax North Korean]|uniref:VIR protein n=1 Tax=Plasmodium vivax North Korean TaxID=1035514 RepID=A0A0J9U113_PLAVI|nr:hypothetical protein PVNG_05792 [Plasmodium vivax North Korean]
MAKTSSTPVVVSTDELEKSALALNLNTLYEALFPEKEKSKFDDQCNKLDTHDKTYVGVKSLCSKFARALEKAAELKDKKEEHKNSCNYLHYWLYDEIGRIKTVDRSQKIDSIPFFNVLIDAANKVNEQIKVGKCTLKFDKNVTLDELVKRKISYIYFKKYNDIKGNIKPEKKDECSKYFTYLTNIKTLYDRYYKDHCLSLWPFSSAAPDYFSCTKTYDPKDLLSKADACKAKGSGGGGFTLFGLLLGGSPSRTSGTGSATVSKEPPRAASSEAKITGSVKNPSPDVPPKDKAAKELPKATVAVDRSKGLSSSTSQEVSLGKVFTQEELMHLRLELTQYLCPLLILLLHWKSSGLKSRFPKRKRKKKIFEHNYYEEYEKELAKYESENESLDSQSDRYYLNYQPEGDSIY